MMHRRSFLLGLSTGLLVTTVGAFAQRPLMKHIGWLESSSQAGLQDYLGTFKRRLAELGYREGEKVHIEARWAAGDFDRLPALARELVDLKVDVIVATGISLLSARQATTSIPIVMMTSSDPVANGTVSSLAHPGGNITGMTRISSQLAAKRLALLRELAPHASRVALVWHAPNSNYTRSVIKETTSAAADLKIPISLIEVRTERDFADAFTEARRQRANALVMMHDGLTFSHVDRLVGLAARNRIPVIYETSEWAAAGGLISYGTNYTALYRRLAEYVEKIFKGTKPGDLPIEQPTNVELVVNLKTAKALGLKAPESILVRADKVIE